MVAFETVCTFASIFLLQQLKPYAADSSDRVQVMARWATAIATFGVMTKFADDGTPGFDHFVVLVCVAVPCLVLGQVLFEFLYTPVAALAEAHPEISVLSPRFWRLLLCEGGYGYHVKDATPMDMFARFESVMVSTGGVAEMQENVMVDEALARDTRAGGASPVARTLEDA